MDKYDGYVKGTKRKLLVYRDLTVEAAIRFLGEHRNGVIYLGDTEYKKEELINVKNIGSDTGVEQDNSVTSGEEIPEDSNRELSEAFGYNTK